MGDKTPDFRALDVMALCRNAARVEGQSPLAHMPRLNSSLFEGACEPTAAWIAQGSLHPAAGGEPEVWLHLQARMAVALQCQRCLQPVTEALIVDRRFRFVRSEAEAERLDEESDDDVLVLEPRLDLTALLEDELILGLPLVPRHLVCPMPLLPPGAVLAQDESAPHPFAALAALRGRPPRDDS